MPAPRSPASGPDDPGSGSLAEVAKAYRALDAPLAEVARAYRALEAENSRLRQELEVAKRDLTELGDDSPSSPSGGCRAASAPVLHVTMPPQASVRRMATSVEVMGVKRNADRARLQHLIADFDPEEQGAWATRPLTVQGCVDLLREAGEAGCPAEDVWEIVERMKAYLLSRRPPVTSATQMHLVDLTSPQQLEAAFGSDLVPSVIALQDVIVMDLTNNLISVGSRRTPVPTPTQPQHQLFKACRSLKKKPWLEIVEGVGTLLVALNTIQLGMSLDMSPEWRGWDWISSGFAVLFLIELVCRVWLAGGLREFYTKEGWKWHALDTAIVMIAMLDIFTLFAGDSAHVNSRTLTIVRVARLPRLTRIMRLARLGFFSELSYMLRGIEAGYSTLVWAMVLLFLVCYVGAVLLTQTVGRDLSNEYFRPYAEKHFATVTLSMFSLFRCFTGDCSVYDGRPMSFILLERYGIRVVPLYLISIVAVTLGLFNVMVANFLQNAQRAARFNDVEKRRILRRERRMVNEKTGILLRRVQEICGTPEADEKQPNLADLKISRETFSQILRDPKVHEWLEDMGCDDSLRNRLFDKIDRDGNGELEATEFVTGVVDFLRGRFDNMETLTTLVRNVHATLAHLERKLPSSRTGWLEAAEAAAQPTAPKKRMLVGSSDVGQPWQAHLGGREVSSVYI